MAPRTLLSVPVILLCALGTASAQDLPRLAPHGGPGAGAPLAVVVHGIHPSPGELDRLADSLARRGYRVYQFHYEDRQDLDRSAAQLAAALTGLLASEPSPSLAVVAHSMGGLVARRALTVEHGQGLGAAGPPITLMTVASPFGGFRSANFARLDLGIGPGSYDDLGTRSKFIRRPGRLAPRVRHVKVETVERGRTVLRGGRRVDDARLDPRHERSEAVDREVCARHVLELGHTEVVLDGDAPSLGLSILLDRYLGPERQAPVRAGLTAKLRGR